MLLTIGLFLLQTASLSVPDRVDPAATRCLTGGDSTRRLAHAEPYAVADSRDPNHLVAAWQVTGGATGMIFTAASFDGGVTWTSPRALPISTCAGGPAEARRASDSWVTIGPDGRVFVAAIGFRPGEGDGPDGFNGLIVVGSGDGGRTWGPPVVAALAESAQGVSFDNVSIAADPTRRGTIYIATTRYAPVTDTAAQRYRSPLPPCR